MKTLRFANALIITKKIAPLFFLFLAAPVQVKVVDRERNFYWSVGQVVTRSLLKEESLGSFRQVKLNIVLPILFNYQSPAFWHFRRCAVQ